MSVKKHIITIAGRPGSGKSSTAKAVATELEFKHFSSGDFFRMIGDEMGIDVLQANLTAEKDAELDRRVDERLAEIGGADDRMVIDSRLAWHWIPASFKVFLDLDLEVAARRVLSGIDEARMKSENIPDEPREYAELLKRRLESEKNRYKSRYSVDVSNMSNYDLVVDTQINSLEEVASLVVKGYRDWIK